MKMIAANFKRSMLCIGSVLTLLGLTAPVQAASCYYGGSSTGERDNNFNFGTVIVQRDAPPGTILATKTSTFAPATNILVCNPTPFRMGWRHLKFSTLSSYGNLVYDTNIAGVGIRVRYPGARALPDADLSSNIREVWLGNALSVELVKTSAGATGSGTISSGKLMRYVELSSGAGGFNATLIGVNQIHAAACTVTNTAIQVPLGNKMRTDFGGIGSTSPDETFNIPLNCNSGTKVKVTLDGDSAGAPGVLKLSPSSVNPVADGIGVQVLYKDRPITFGSPLDAGTASSAGAFNIPLKARYYQTKAGVTTGEANATATFTMTFN